MVTGEPPTSDDIATEAEGRYGEFLVALFLLGVVMFHPLVLDVFDLIVIGSGEQPEAMHPAMVFGIPLLFFYVFFAWGLLIALLALVLRRASHNPGSGAGAPTEGEIE